MKQNTIGFMKFEFADDFDFEYEKKWFGICLICDTDQFLAARQDEYIVYDAPDLSSTGIASKIPCTKCGHTWSFRREYDLFEINYGQYIYKDEEGKVTHRTMVDWDLVERIEAVFEKVYEKVQTDLKLKQIQDARKKRRNRMFSD